jgi:hypothetical protein
MSNCKHCNTVLVYSDEIMSDICRRCQKQHRDDSIAPESLFDDEMDLDAIAKESQWEDDSSDNDFGGGGVSDGGGSSDSFDD